MMSNINILGLDLRPKLPRRFKIRLISDRVGADIWRIKSIGLGFRRKRMGEYPKKGEGGRTEGMFGVMQVLDENTEEG